MTSEDMVIAGREADQLRKTPAFEAAVKEARQVALERLASIDPLKTEEIRDAQATVRAIDLLATSLGNAIIRGKTAEKNPVA